MKNYLFHYEMDSILLVNMLLILEIGYEKNSQIILVLTFNNKKKYMGSID
jgi:hypothetical protein